MHIGRQSDFPDFPEDRRVGNLIDEIFEKIWPEMDVPGASKYKVIIEAAE
jgi:hypothetical protein